MNFNKFIVLLFLSFGFSQFNNVEVTLEYNRLTENELYKIENLESEIKNYFQFNNFCQEYDFIEIDLSIHLVIESIKTLRTSTGTVDEIKSHILISNNQDQFYFNKGVIFEHNKNKTFIFNPYIFKGLESVFNYYAFLFIGYELDRWGFNLGTTYFNKSLEISYEGSRQPKWKARKDEIKNILENSNLRELRFLFFSYLGIINSKNYSQDPALYNDEIKNIFTEIYNKIYAIYKKNGQDKNTLKFLNYYSTDIVQVFKYYNMLEEISFLASYDNDNKEKYLEYLK